MSDEAVDAFLEELRKLKQKVRERQAKANRLKAAHGQTMGLSPTRPKCKPKKRISLYARAANPTIDLRSKESSQDQNANDLQKQDQSHPKRDSKKLPAKVKELFEKSRNKSHGAACRKYRSPKDIGTHQPYPSITSYPKPIGDEIHYRLYDESRKTYEKKLETEKAVRLAEMEELANMKQWKPILTGFEDERERQREAVHESFEAVSSGKIDVFSKDQMVQVFKMLNIQDPDSDTSDPVVERLWKNITLQEGQYNAAACCEFLCDCCSVKGGSAFHQEIRQRMFGEKPEVPPQPRKVPMTTETLDRLCHLPEPVQVETEDSQVTTKPTQKLEKKPIQFSPETQELLGMTIQERQEKLAERSKLKARIEDLRESCARIGDVPKKPDPHEMAELRKRVEEKQDARWEKVLRDTNFSFVPETNPQYKRATTSMEVNGFEKCIERQRKAREAALERRSIERSLKI